MKKRALLFVLLIAFLCSTIASTAFAESTDPATSTAAPEEAQQAVPGEETKEESVQQPEKPEEAPASTAETDPKPQAPLTLNATSLTLLGGDYFVLIPTTVPNTLQDQVVFSSSNESVAFVDANHTIRTLKKGTAIITASTAAGKVTAQCKVKVISNPIIKKAQDGTRIIGPVYTNNVYQLYTGLSKEYEDKVQKHVNNLGLDTHEKIVKYAAQYMGVSYSTLDCSELTRAAYKAAGVSIKGRSDQQAKSYAKRALNHHNYQPGDLLFFRTPDGEDCPCSGRCYRYMGIHHVGIYAGKIDGVHYIIDSSSTLKKVVCRQWDGSEDFAEMKFVFAARVVK